MIYEVDAIFDHGVFRPLQPLTLPDGLRVRLRIREERDSNSSNDTRSVFSPRLANPEQAAEFVLEVADEWRENA